jgi:hypothetical protein
MWLKWLYICKGIRTRYTSPPIPNGSFYPPCMIDPTEVDQLFPQNQLSESASYDNSNGSEQAAEVDICIIWWM